MQNGSHRPDAEYRRRPCRFEVQPHQGPAGSVGRWYSYRGELLTGSVADGPDTSDVDGSDIREVERRYRAAFIEVPRAAVLGCSNFALLAEIYSHSRETIKYSDLVRVKQRGGDMLLRRRGHGLELAMLRGRSQAAAHMAEAAKDYAEAGVDNQEFRTRILPGWIVELQRWNASSRASAIPPPEIPLPPKHCERRSAQSARNSDAGF